MTPLEQSILQTLNELNAVVKAMPVKGGGDLARLFTRLDELTGELPVNTAPDLLHYLRRKSYEKARLWLEGRDAENTRGACRHA